jgi:hypothetical protein
LFRDDGSRDIHHIDCDHGLYLDHGIYDHCDYLDHYDQNSSYRGLVAPALGALRAP